MYQRKRMWTVCGKSPVQEGAWVAKFVTKEPVTTGRHILLVPHHCRLGPVSTLELQNILHSNENIESLEAGFNPFKISLYDSCLRSLVHLRNQNLLLYSHVQC